MASALRVIVHPGFHKTGTTTLQQALRLNRRSLSPHLRIILRPGMVAVCDSARAWSATNNPLDLALFQYEFAQLVEGWPHDDPRPVLLASEDLCGHMPGRYGVTSYAAAPGLMHALSATLGQIRPKAELCLFFSTRAAEPWLASCYAQHLAASRMTLTETAYSRDFHGSANLDTVIDRVADSVAPHRVHSCALEDSQDRRLGPLDPLMDLVALPANLRTRLQPHPTANRAPSRAILERLLKLNQSDLDDKPLRAAKKALLKRAG